MILNGKVSQPIKQEVVGFWRCRRVVAALKLIMNIEQDEYLSELTEKAGVRVVVHPQHEMPFPEENGVAAAPGHSTAIAVRQVRRWPYARA